MTQTKEYSLPRKEYTKIVLSKRLKKSWWLYLLTLILGIFHFQKFGEDSFSTFFTIFAFCYPVLVFTYLYFWANSKGHDPIFSKTSLSFDNEYLYFKSNDNETKLNPKSIQKVVSNTQYWLLYISKGKFIYIPKNIFYLKEDCKMFLALIKTEH